MINLIQYAVAVYAFGARLAYDTRTGEMDIASYPNRVGAREILDAALVDIQLFENTANFDDGLSVIALSDFLDNKENPVTETSRLNILRQIGIMREGKFVRQILERAKVNKSWHISETYSSCSLFGELCTHRGIQDTSHRRGRKSERNPDEYHLKSSKGIGREQLVTPALETLYDNIPPENLIAASKDKIISLPNIEDMNPNELLVLMEKVTKELNSRV